ncbi:outer membrane beta-barrel family protein [Chitinophaga sp. S165]|uniref:outer membrane beta-barrel family protein n=1 Tax=Chitinophaga sp. S165 TaxID=2135462 RepID=UPI000D70B272|nr:outer membrane beta-barrel family protein [Chitinophaga sp. S165]PWV56578.1 outer membrane receptor protein involved in Fe transport [Chitinophaga sp. S165]
MKGKLFIHFFLLFIIAVAKGQSPKVNVTGVVKDATDKNPLSFVSVTLKTPDSNFVAGTITGDDGRFSLPDIRSGNYLLIFSYVGYKPDIQPFNVGQLSAFLDLGNILLTQNARSLNAVTVSGKQEDIRMDKKTFNVADNISQAGGSVLEAMKNLPGVTTTDGKIQLRGSDKVMVLIDGRQTALTGFGSQTSLDNIPASAIERIEIINNPSSKYDANGNAGIINIIYKKEKHDGFNGKIGFSGGLGALWIKRENYPAIRPQYHATPKINPSLSLNYRKNRVNLFLQADDLYTKTLNKNEFVDRFYDNGDTVKQQTKRNRTTNFSTVKAGMDWSVSNSDIITVSGLFGTEKILDRGDEPFFNGSLSERQRLWQFLEDELKTTATFSASWQHRFSQPGRTLNVGLNATFHRENEKYFFTNIMPEYTGLDSFKVLSDEHVTDLTVDYVHPLKHGRFEGGMKFRYRYIPVNMDFKPGIHSVLDASAGGWAKYKEIIPALYGNYVYESNKVEIEAGLRIEYVNLVYDVNPTHPTYKSDGYNYTQPFPNLRLAYKLSANNKLSVYYNRRVDRPNEGDIRIFPKYDDAEIIKVGNPALRPQYTNTFELGDKTSWNNGSLFSSLYHKRMDATITRIASSIPGSTLIYNVFQNAGKSYNTGIELIISQKVSEMATFNLNLNGYQNIVDSFSVVNKYPVENVFSAAREDLFSGNIKLNGQFHFPRQIEAQLTAIYQAPDLVPQGKTFSRFSVDAGIKKAIQHGKGEVFVNAADIANTLRIKKEVNGNGFRYTSTDYNETQVIRLGYSYKF